MLNDSTHPDDDRFLYVSSQSFVSKETIKNLLKGFDMHYVDSIIWPVNVEKSHWILLVISPANLQCRILDPYSPRTLYNFQGKFRQKIVNGLDSLSMDYTSRYQRDIQWKILQGSDLVERFNLCEQPEQNSTDCGVFVLIYIWCICTGQKFPDIQLSVRTIEVIRQHIGLLILDRAA